jgi:hypothetical protein
MMEENNVSKLNKKISEEIEKDIIGVILNVYKYASYPHFPM